MKITVLTSNQPRHLALISQLSEIATEVYAIQEITTLFPGKIADFYKSSEIMQTYFTQVRKAEFDVFGEIGFLPKNVRQLPMKLGDLNLASLEKLSPALDADFFIVFGSSYIKGPLCDYLVEKKALNIHMGLSPYYRGSSCNFWALYDGRPEYVGATIHLLSKGLDSGPILFHAVPPPRELDGFALGMSAVKYALRGVVGYLKNNKSFSGSVQDKSKQIRYSRNSEFTDEIASQYLARQPLASEIFKRLSERDLSNYINLWSE